MLGDRCSIVHKLCERNQNGGQRWGPLGCSGGGQNNNNTDFSVSAVETEDTNTAANSSLTMSENNDRGGCHGCGFG